MSSLSQERTKDKNYPFDVTIKKEGNEYFLVERGNRYALGTTRFTMLFLEIFELNSRIFISQKGCFEEKLTGKARFRDYSTISFFGCDRKLQYINIDIYPRKNTKNSKVPLDIGFQFLGSEKYDSDEVVIEENIEIKLFICNSQFQKIKYSLENKLIKNIYCNSPISILPTSEFVIEGLYREGSFYPDKKYKVLCNKDRITNKKDLPTYFTTTSYRMYKESFDIKIITESLFNLDKTDNLKDKTDNLDIDFIQKAIKEVKQTKHLDCILKYIQYIFFALVIIIIKLYNL